jgi:hypothetical protein
MYSYIILTTNLYITLDSVSQNTTSQLLHLSHTSLQLITLLMASSDHWNLT